MNYEKALYIDSVNLKYELNDFNLIHIENLLYNQAWAYYEIDREQNNQKIQRKFWAAQRFAEFNRKVNRQITSKKNGSDLSVYEKDFCMI